MFTSIKRDRDWELEKLAGLDPSLAERKRTEIKVAVEADRAERATDRKNPPERTPMTEKEQAAVKALAGCRFGAGGGRARSFVSSMEIILRHETPEITKRQRFYMWGLVYRYRRQIADKSLVAEAKTIRGIKEK